ncbi:hypothetical protein OG792_14495 [Micromonospora sp. NBC_01699]|uniref:hypothetical protein n=1 Tax=Micromonospora sp. NBC_01699 TaxID=2975984 RepID=UPI002E323079|nr:hypothetical protein [Micromonospora sp. NBC_01699]
MSNATLLARVTERWAEFLAQQSDEQLVAFARGDLCLTFTHVSADQVSAGRHAATGTPIHLPAPTAQPTATAPEPTTPPAKRPRRAGPAAPRKPAPEAAGIAARLRELESETEGDTYLAGFKPSGDLLRDIGAELGLKLGKLNKTELTRRILDQAIGARRKFAGLRNW